LRGLGDEFVSKILFRKEWNWVKKEGMGGGAGEIIKILG
jgi:hypothetical protein